MTRVLVVYHDVNVADIETESCGEPGSSGPMCGSDRRESLPGAQWRAVLAGGGG